MNQTIRSWEQNRFLISTDKTLLQIPKIHRFLSQEAYWSLEIPRDMVQNAIEKSLCYGVYESSQGNLEQIGFARVITDFTTFAWICDVYIEKQFRGQGLSKWLMRSLMSDLESMKLRRICLATKDAHELYKKFGIEVTRSPENWMERKDNDIYTKLRR